jgi:hypothetical protein
MRARLCIAEPFFLTLLQLSLLLKACVERTLLSAAPDVSHSGARQQRGAHGTVWNQYADSLVKNDPNRYLNVQTPDFLKHQLRKWF